MSSCAQRRSALWIGRENTISGFSSCEPASGEGLPAPITIRRLTVNRESERAIWHAIGELCCRTGNNGEPIAPERWRLFAKIWIEPYEKQLSILGLGGSIATPANGVTASVVVVSSFDELEKLGLAKVKGKIVITVG